MSNSHALSLPLDAPCSSPPLASPTHGSSGPHKRECETRDHQPLLFDSFSISDTCTSITIHPHLAIPRQSLPLSLFDLSQRNDSALPFRIFTSDHELLRASLFQTYPDPTLLVASVDLDTQLYVIENAANNLYSLCRLAPWLNLNTVRHWLNLAAKCWSHRRVQAGNPSDEGASTWWVPASYRATSISRNTGASSPIPAVSLEHGSDAAISPTEPRTVDTRVLVESSHAEPTPSIPLHDNATTMTLEKACREIALQYLEVLYLSKASVAYFPKSTLSRARAFVDTSQDDSVTRVSLATAIREMIFTNSTFEKRYDSKLLESLKSQLQADVALETAEQTSQGKRNCKEKQLKKPKPGRDGLYSVEPDYLVKWWHAESSRSPEFTDAAMRRDIVRLRYRESLLQVILVLEALALEDNREPPAASETQQSESAQGESQSQAPPRAKKPKNLHIALESLVDKVCIWDSIDSLADSPLKSQAASNKENENTAVGGRSDRLKQFCVDVLIPFYLPRLPKKVEEIAARMGVSIATSPHKRSERFKRKAEPAPGSEIKRHPLQSKRRQIERVGSDSSRLRGMPPPALSRSSTDTLLLPDLKRERSSTSHDDFRLNRRTLSRTNSVNSGRAFQQRTVDMSALNQYKANKEKHKPAIDRELKDAISVLKKPNRGATAREFADEAAQRASARSKQAAKSRLEFQIGMTPRKDSRTASQSFAKPDPSRLPQARPASPEMVPSSSKAFVPSSTVKPASGSVRRGNFSNIFETPSRGPSRMIDALQRVPNVESPGDLSADAVPQSVVKAVMQTSPTLAKSTASLAQPDFSKPSSRPQPALTVDDTPVKKTAVALGPRDTSMKPPSMPDPKSAKDTPMQPSPAGSKSIYDILGWDDEDDDELL